MSRLAAADLLPGTNYSIQVRAIGREGNNSEWSPRVLFTTIDDSVLPQVPTSLTWVTAGDSFHAEWSPVLLNVNGDITYVDRYEVELVGNAVTVTRAVTKVNTAGKVTFDLSFEENIAAFGSPAGTVTIRVRAVDTRGLISAWTSIVSVSNAVPATPVGASVPVTTGVDNVSLNWLPVADQDLIGYRVYVGSTAGFTPALANRVFNGNSTQFTYVTTTYTLQYFKIRAVDKFGQESADLVLSGTPVSPFVLDTTPPAVPTVISADLVNNANGRDGILTIVWDITPVTADLAGFRVRYRPAGSSFYTFLDVDPATRTLVIPVPAYILYKGISVLAYDQSGNSSAYSTPLVSATNPAPPTPANVTGLTSVAGRDSITYNWTATADLNLVNYEVTFSTSSTFASGNLTYFTGLSTSLTVSGLAPGTTYYARVRAINIAGIISAAWSATDTKTTLTYATYSSDGIIPSGSPAATVTPGIGYLFVSWPAQTNADPVTYEVHISTTNGFTPTAGGATMVAKTSGTNIGLEKDAAGTVLAYGTTYYVKLFARDADGPAAAAGTQGSGAIAQAGTIDMAVNSITAASGILATASVGTANIIDANITTAKINDLAVTTAKITDLAVTDAKINTLAVTKLTAGTVGGGFGITMAAGSSILLNGGMIKSNTYTGTTQATNPSGAGFYLGNDGIRIDQGKVSATAFSGGTFTGGNFIVGSGGAVRSSNYNVGVAGWNLSDSGLEINSGVIKAATLELQAGKNLLRPEFASFGVPATNYSTMVAHSAATLTDVVTTPKYGTKSLNVAWDGTGSSNFQFRLGSSSTDYNIPVEANTSYIFSAWVRNRSAVSTAITLSVNWSTGAGSNAVVLTPNVSSATWVRMSGALTSPAGATGAHVALISGSLTSGANFDVDGVQVEYQTGSTTNPSPWTPPGVTTMNGYSLRTGAIISTGIAQVWDVTLNPIGTPMVYTTNSTTTLVATAGTFLPADVGRVVSGTGITAGTTIASYTNATTVVMSVTATATATGVAGFVYRSAAGGYKVDPFGRPAWSIDLAGNAVFGQANILGNVVVGQSTDPNTAIANVASSNYVPGTSGWTIRGDGFAEFRQMAADSISGDTIKANTLDVKSLKNGDLNAAINIKGSIIVTNPTTFAQVGISYDKGFFVYGPSPDGGISQGPTYISFPVDGAPNIISGTLKATTLEVSGDPITNNAASFYKNSTIQPSAKFTLLDTATTTQPPVVSLTYPLTAINDSTYGILETSLTLSPDDGFWYGVYRSGTPSSNQSQTPATYYIRGFNSSGTLVYTLTIGTNSNSSGVLPHRVQGVIRSGGSLWGIYTTWTPSSGGTWATNFYKIDPATGNWQIGGLSSNVSGIPFSNDPIYLTKIDANKYVVGGVYGAISQLASAFISIGNWNASGSSYTVGIYAPGPTQTSFTVHDTDVLVSPETTPDISGVWIGVGPFGATRMLLVNRSNTSGVIPMFTPGVTTGGYTNRAASDTEWSVPASIPLGGIQYNGTNFIGISAAGVPAASGNRAFVKFSSITWTTGTTGRWGVASTRYDTVGGYQSTASPVAYFNMIKRATLSVTADSGTSNAARIYVGRKTTDNQNPSTEMYYNTPQAGTGVTVTTYDNITFSGTNAPVSSTFPAAGANGGKIVSFATDSLIDATSVASTEIRADGYIRMKSPIAYQITLRSATAVGASSGLETALRVGTPTGQHLRVGPSGVFGMNSDTVQGSFQTNNPMSEMRNTNAQSLPTPWTLIQYGVGTTRGNITQSGTGFHTIAVSGYYLCIGFVKTTVAPGITTRSLCKIESYTTEAIAGGANIAQVELCGHQQFAAGPGTWNPVGVAYLTAGMNVRMVWYNSTGTYTTYVDNTPFATSLTVMLIS